MDRTRPQPGWIVLLAALSEVATAAPSRADAGLFDFDGAYLSEQTAVVDPSVLDGARRLRLDGFQAGSLRLGLDIQKAAPPPDPLRAFHYTVADARKDWLRSLSAAQPRRLALTGAVDHGAARGLSFMVTRNDSGADAAMESRLSFERSGFSADIQLRNVGGHFARSALMSDDEWNRMKDIVGWRQSDMRFQWKAMPNLSLASEMSQGRRSDTGDTRGHRRLSLDWSPGKSSHFSLYNEVNTTGGKEKRGSRATKRGFAWNQTVNGLAFGISQDEEGAANGKSTRTRTLNFATPEKARTRFTYQRTDTRKDAGSSTVQAMTFHAKPTDSLELAADYTLVSGTKARRNRGVQLKWQAADQWRVDGQWRQDTAADGPMSDLHLTGAPSKQLQVDARMQRITDPKNPYRRQDTLRVDGKPSKGLAWSAQYAVMTKKNGASATVLDANAKLLTRLGVLTAAWRDGDVDVLPGYTDVSFTSVKSKDAALSFDAHLRQRQGALDSQTMDLAWKASDRLTVKGSYALNPEDKDGRPQNLTSHRLAMEYAVSDGLRFDVSHSIQEGPGGVTECSDLSLKGKLDDQTTVDLGVAMHSVPGVSRAPAYHVDVEHTVDDDNRFHLAVERKTLAVQRKDDLTASLQLVSSF